MPKICYTKWEPRPADVSLIKAINRILAEYTRAGYDLILRQLYYQMIAKDLFPDTWIDEAYNARKGLAPDTKNTVKNYKRLGTIVSKAREAGLIDWDHIVDRGREWQCRPRWNDPSHFLTSVAPQFGIDRWKDQPIRVEVWVEKDSLSGIIERACEPLDVPYFACKGYTSASAIWEAAHRRILKRYAKAGQDTVIIHLGDHDPSGIDMSRDIEDRLRRFSSPTNGDFRPTIRVNRIALNMDQIKEFDPPPNPAKETDPRAKKYVEEYGEDSWELDALEPATIVSLIQESIRTYMDEEMYEAAEQREVQWREQLVAMADGWSPDREDDE
jgi:hypothetical protein